MQELNIENELELKVLINGVPDYTKILEDTESGFLEALEFQICEYYKVREQNDNIQRSQRKR